jgi:hypothetical protein
MNLSKMPLFKKKSLEDIKQPQEYYCSNIECTNEAAQFNELAHLLTDEAYNDYADFYCMDCIINDRIIH